jgi:hypothetical protein
MRELLELAVPPYDGPSDWPRVLREARVARRRRIALRLSLVVAAAAVLVALLASPPSTLDRALAAAGTGGVLHLTFESVEPRTLVDVRTGAPRAVEARHEVWFDPHGETRERETFNGTVLWDSLNPSAHGREIYGSLLTGYRDALRDGTAQVVSETGSVYWIRIAPGHEIAVSRETYTPVAQRVGGHELRILGYETVDRVPPAAQAPPPPPGSARQVWAGKEIAGERLSADGDVLRYGEHIEIHQSATPMVNAFTPPPGTMVVAGATAYLHTHGRYVLIVAPEDDLLEIARALRVR